MRSNAGMADRVTPTCAWHTSPLPVNTLAWLRVLRILFPQAQSGLCVNLMERQSCTKMNFLKKLRLWKRMRNGAVTRNIAKTDNRNSETDNQVSSIEMILRCHAGTRVDSILTCEVSTQTSNVNERPQNNQRWCCRKWQRRNEE